MPEERQHPPATGDYSRRGSERWKALRAVITRSRLDCSLPQIEDAEEAAMIASWGALLEPVPTRFLDRAYTKAMREHCASDEARGPFKAGMILKAYQQICLSGQLERAMTAEGRYLMDT